MRPSQAVTTACVALITACLGLYLLTRADGLRGQYFPDATFSGRPSVSELNRTVSSAEVYKSWRAAPPATFSVQWSGYLNLHRPGRYAVRLDSDGTSDLFLDGKRVAADQPI